MSLCPCSTNESEQNVLGEGLPPKTLIRAPFCAFSIVMFVTETFATMSVSPAYWPRLPTETPCDPLQNMFATTMFVLFGLNAISRTNSGEIQVGEKRKGGARTDTVIVIHDDRVADRHKGGAVDVPTV